MENDFHGNKKGGLTFFVEDNPAALGAAKHLVPHIITVRMRRNQGIYGTQPVARGVDHEVRTMRGFEHVLRGYNENKNLSWIPSSFRKIMKKK